VLCGPTGIGKTRVAIELAAQLGCEIISSDSRQLYREMAIGTAVPTPGELSRVPHHFIQNHSVQESYNASSFEQEVLEFLDSYYQRNHIALMVGGSGMYIDAVCQGIDDLPTIKEEVRIKWRLLYQEKGLEYLQQQVTRVDPDYAKKVDLYNPNRMLKALEVFEQTGRTYSSFLTHTAKERPFRIHKLALDMDRQELYEQINRRVDQMEANGLVEEARRMLPCRQLTPLKTVGYKELFQHFDGELTLEEALIQIKNHSRAYARRQLTWFRRDKQMQWFHPKDLDAMLQWIQEQLSM